MAQNRNLSDERILEQLQKNEEAQQETTRGIFNIVGRLVDEERDRQRAYMDAVEARREEKRQREKGTTYTFMDGVKEGMGLPIGAGSGLMSGIIEGIFGAGTFAVMQGMIAKIIGRGLKFGGLATIVTMFGQDLIEFTLKQIPGLDTLLTDEQKEGIAGDLTTAISTGLIFRFLGASPLRAFMGALGMFIGKKFADYFNVSDEEKAKIFNFELPFSELDFVTYGATIAAFFAPSLIRGAIISQLSAGGAAAGAAAYTGASVGRDAQGRFTKLKPSLRNRFFSSFRPGRLGWAAVLGAAATTLGGFIGDVTGSEEFGNMASWGLNGAALGLMFGPQGAIIGAAVGLAIYGGKKIFDYMRNVREKNLAKIDEDLEGRAAEIAEALEEGSSAKAAELIARQQMEINRANEMGLNKALESYQNALDAQANAQMIEQQLKDDPEAKFIYTPTADGSIVATPREEAERRMREMYGRAADAAARAAGDQSLEIDPTTGLSPAGQSLLLALENSIKQIETTAAAEGDPNFQLTPDMMADLVRQLKGTAGVDMMTVSDMFDLVERGALDSLAFRAYGNTLQEARRNALRENYAEQYGLNTTDPYDLFKLDENMLPTVLKTREDFRTPWNLLDNEEAKYLSYMEQIKAYQLLQQSMQAITGQMLDGVRFGFNRMGDPYANVAPQSQILPVPVPQPLQMQYAGPTSAM